MLTLQTHTICSHVRSSTSLVLHIPHELLIIFSFLPFLIVIDTLKFCSPTSPFFFVLRSSCSSSFCYQIFTECFISFILIYTLKIIFLAFLLLLKFFVSQFVELHVLHVLILNFSWENFCFLRSFFSLRDYLALVIYWSLCYTRGHLYY